VQDYVYGWNPEPGERLNPSTILDAVKVVLDTYSLGGVYSDQYQLESLQELALDRGFTVFGFDLTKSSKPKAMQALNLKLNAGKLVLCNNPTQTLQLRDLVRTNLDGGGQRIAAPPGKHDDFATVTALGVHLAELLPEHDAKTSVEAQASGSRDKSVILAEVAQRLYDEMYASGDPMQQAVLDRSDYLRALVEG
jgi:hypothetical protein